MNTDQNKKLYKYLLVAEIIISVLAMLILLAMVFVASFLQMEQASRIILIVGGTMPMVIVLPFLIKIEQISGYYYCPKCSHTYIPQYKDILWSQHFGWSRIMRCPQCGKKSLHKKVLEKKDDQENKG